MLWSWLMGFAILVLGGLVVILERRHEELMIKYTERGYTIARLVAAMKDEDLEQCVETFREEASQKRESLQDPGGATP